MMQWLRKRIECDGGSLGNKAVYTYTTPSTYLTQTYQGSSTLLGRYRHSDTNHLVERVITLPNGLTSTTKSTTV